MSSLRQAAAGFYPDPAQPGMERYWDGRVWTEQRRPAEPAPPAAGRPSVEPEPGQPVGSVPVEPPRRVGWHRDPDKPGWDRYWTGSRWAAARRVTPPEQPRSAGPVLPIGRPSSGSAGGSSAGRWWAAAAVVATLYVIGALAAGGSGPAGEECEDAYRNDYVFYGEPGAMSMEAYCENFNDTSWLDDVEDDLQGTYE